MSIEKFNPGYKSHPYWRKSKLNGLKCIPVNLSLSPEGMFSMTSKDGKVFDVPFNEVHLHMTSFGTMVLTIRGEKYDLVKMGAAVSPMPSAELREEMSGYLDLFEGRDEETIDPLLRQFLVSGSEVSKWVPIFLKRDSAYA